MKLNFIAATLMCAVCPQSFAVSQAFLDGQVAGNSMIGPAAGSISQSNLDAIGNPYGASNNQALMDTFATSNAGNAGLGPVGSKQLSDCQNVPSNADARYKQYCDATNELAKNPLEKARNTTGLTKSDSIVTNPNNAFHAGMAAVQANNVSTSIGTGAAQANVNSASACVTTTEKTPPVYTTQTCDRAVGTSTVPCTRKNAPSITATPGCSISGSVFVNNAAGTPIFSITFSCDPVVAGVGVAVITPVGALPGVSTPYVSQTIKFVPGTSQTVSWDALPILSTIGQTAATQNNMPVTAMFNASTNSFALQSNGPFSSSGYDTSNCATGYAYVFPSAGVPGYCTSATDPASVQVVSTGIGVVSGIKYCPAGTTQYAGANNTVTCLKPAPDYFLVQTGPVDRGVRHYAYTSGNYTGNMNVVYTVTDHITDSCATYQAQTDAPAANPAVAVNGTYICPTGMTVSGGNCI